MIKKEITRKKEIKNKKLTLRHPRFGKLKRRLLKRVVVKGVNDTGV